MVMINPLLFIPGLRLHLVVSSRRLHCVLLQYLLRKQQEGAAEVVVTLILPDSDGRRQIIFPAQPPKVPQPVRVHEKAVVINETTNPNCPLALVLRNLHLA